MMRFCLMPSTICSICRRNWSLVADDDIALRDKNCELTGLQCRHRHLHLLLQRCSRLYSLLEVVVNGVQQIHLQTGTTA